MLEARRMLAVHEDVAPQGDQLTKAPIRVLVAGGGTGGHLFPGIAVAEQIRDMGGEVLFVGTRQGIEARVLPSEGWPLQFVKIRGIKGRGLRGLISGLWVLPQALWSSRRLIRAFQPSVVIGVGGYASGPVVATAALMGIPTAILEQNSVPGVTNRLLGRFVRWIFCAFEDRLHRFPAAKVRLVGNPIRQAIAEQMRARGAESSSEGPRLLVFGGSQGARAINEVMPEAVARLVRRHPNLSVRHQTGLAEQARVQAAYRAHGLDTPQISVEAFIHDMAAAYAWCDLAICRAGATSLAELAVAGCPALLIPFPYATDDHQRWNAQSLVDQGAAELLLQADATPEFVGTRVAELLADRDRLDAMRKAMERAGRPDAALTISRELVEMAGSRPG